MEYLGLHPGDSAWIDLDLDKVGAIDITVNDGPIESSISEPLGDVFDTRTRFYGKVWTSGPFVVIRYYEARRLNPGPAIPICAVARLGNEELKKNPGPTPGCPPGCAVLKYSSAGIYIVDSFR